VTAVTEQEIRDLAETAAGLVDEIIPDGEGACLGTSAILAHVLATHGIPTTAVRGEYDEHPHWWLETGALRVDATRAQFDTRPIVESLADINSRDEDPYLTEETFPGRWSREQAVIEFARMFTYTSAGEAHALRVVAALEAFAGRRSSALATEGA
jgi:hypothetical protein